MTPDQQALWQRFDGFLGKIEERLKEVMAEAENGLGVLFAQHPTDPMPIGNAMSGLDHRVKELVRKIGETWDAQIGPKFEAMSDPRFHDAGLDRKRDFELHLEEKWDAFKAQAMSAYYRAMWPLVQAAMAKPVPCNRCGAELALPVRHESISHTCAHCGSVNQVLVDPAVSYWFGGGAAHVFAEEAALPLRYAVERHRIAVDRDRRARSWGPETIEQLREWDRLENAYWTRYAEVKAQVLGKPIDRELIDSRMSQFRKYSLETNQVWKRANP